MFDWYVQSYLILKTVDFAEMETQFPIKHKTFEKLRVSGFRLHPDENEIFQLNHVITSPVLGNKHYSYRLSLQRKQIHLVFRILHMKLRISPKSAKPFAFCGKRFSRPAKPAKSAKPTVFGTGESIKNKPIKHTQSIQKIVPRFCGRCAGTVASIVPVFKLHRPGPKTETLLKSIRQLVAESWERKWKIRD